MNKYRRIRTELNLSQAQMADKVGMTQSNWGKVENGKLSLNGDAVLILTQELNVNPAFLLKGAEPVFINKLDGDINITPQTKRFVEVYKTICLDNNIHSVAELAKALGEKETTIGQTISQAKLGKRNLPDEFIMKFIKKFKLDPVEFFGKNYLKSYTGKETEEIENTANEPENEYNDRKLKGYEIALAAKDEILKEKERLIASLQNTNERYGRIIDTQLQQLQST